MRKNQLSKNRNYALHIHGFLALKLTRRCTKADHAKNGPDPEFLETLITFIVLLVSPLHSFFPLCSKNYKNGHVFLIKGTNMIMIMPDIISDFPILCRPSKNTLFEKDSKCRIWIWHFPSICGLLKLTCLVTLIDRKLQFCNSKCKLDCDFFCDFQPPWTHSFIQLL